MLPLTVEIVIPNCWVMAEVCCKEGMGRQRWVMMFVTTTTTIWAVAEGCCDEDMGQRRCAMMAVAMICWFGQQTTVLAA
jgi:hypothetical protein